MSGIEERIAAVLRFHQRRFDCNHPAWGHCYCGFNPDADAYPQEAQAEHITEVLVAELGLRQEKTIGVRTNNIPASPNAERFSMTRYVTAWTTS